MSSIYNIFAHQNIKVCILRCVTMIIDGNNTIYVYTKVNNAALTICISDMEYYGEASKAL